MPATVHMRSPKRRGRGPSAARTPSSGEQQRRRAPRRRAESARRRRRTPRRPARGRRTGRAPRARRRSSARRRRRARRGRRPTAPAAPPTRSATRHQLIMATLTAATLAPRSPGTVDFSRHPNVRTIARCSPQPRDAAPHRFRALDVGSRLRSSDDVSVGGGDRRGALLRRDALRSAAIRSIRRRIASCCRRATRAPILYAAWAAAGAFPRDGSAEAAQDRRPISKAIRRRGCRSSTSRPDRSGRACAPASASRSTRGASRPTTARTCCSATARARKAPSGKRRSRRASQARQSLRDHRRQRSRPEPRDAVGSRSRRRSRRAGARSAGTPSRSTATTSPRSSQALAEARNDQGPADDDRGAARSRARACKLFEGKDGWHGKALKKGAETDQALAELDSADRADGRSGAGDSEAGAAAAPKGRCPTSSHALPAPAYKLGDSVATREAYGAALVALGAHRSRASSRSTPTSRTRPSARSSSRRIPDRFYQVFIAEQVMIGAAMGLASRGAIPFPSTFACFLERAQRLHPHGGHLESQHQARRIARRRVDRRGRAVADGARGSRDDARRAELHGAVPVRRRERRAADGARGRRRRARSTSASSRPKTPVIYERERDVRRRRLEDAAPERRRTS